jgi:CheY-like chemotaxis protein
MTETALKVLLAEDHPVNRRTIQLILEPFGFEILEAADGVEAVDLYQRQAFDVILMDMQMPNLDGLEATRAIRAMEAKTGRGRIPIVMVSANAMPAHAELALAAGCDVHVPKPITPTSLMEGLRQAFARAEQA